MKEFKDYHLYLGCEIEFNRLGSWHISKLTPSLLEDFLDGDVQIKLILRPLSDMTEDEENEIEGEFGSYGLGENHLCNALKEHDLRYVKKLDEAFELTRYLLSKYFDLFGLIEAGLAIDKTKLKPIK